jgi:hypothetical protein
MHYNLNKLCLCNKTLNHQFLLLWGSISLKSDHQHSIEMSDLNIAMKLIIWISSSVKLFP